jgi:hypothetical protein
MNDAYESIRKLCFTYTFALDEGDFERVAEVLAAAELRMVWREFDDRTVTGREEIRDFYADQVLTYDRNPRTRHVISNQLIEIDEAAATATSRAYFTLLQAPADGGFALVGGGQYHDGFAKRDGVWEFRRKTIQVDYLNDPTQHFLISADFRPDLEG